MTQKIIADYKQTGSFKKTWIHFAHLGYTREKIAAILKDAGIYKKRGNFSRGIIFELVPDERKVFTDADLDFDLEISTKLY